MIEPPSVRRVVVVTGLSGAGKASILHVLEDLGYATIDNLPLALIGNIAAHDPRSIAFGVDARTSGFSAAAMLGLVAELRGIGATPPELVFATASDEVLHRRYTETRRRHPLAPRGRVIDGIRAEAAMLDPLRAAADLLIDTSALPLPKLRQVIEARFGTDASVGALTITLVSFAYPKGLPGEADLVFDARFLRNPHYVPALRHQTGLDAPVGAYIAQDPDFAAFEAKIVDLLHLLLPRFVHEGKRYVTIGIGCTGGRHRSVYVVEQLTKRLGQDGWRATRTHRDVSAAMLVRESASEAPGSISSGAQSEGPANPAALADQPAAQGSRDVAAREA